jgi:hypothetical protein
MIENINQVESSLGLAEGTLQEAIASEDAKTIEIPVGKFIDTEKHEIFTKEDFLKRVSNIKEESEVIGVEKAVKKARTDMTLDFEGSRKGGGENVKLLIDAAIARATKDSGVEPNEKIKELTIDLDKLKGMNSDWESKYNNLVTESSARDNQRKIDGNILESITGELTLSKPQITTLFKSEFEVVEEDGKQLIKKGGQTLKHDTTLEPLSLADVMPKFLEPFAKKVTGGGGGGDTIEPGKAGSMDAFIKEMTDKGVSSGSEAFNIEMGKRISDKTLTM